MSRQFLLATMTALLVAAFIAPGAASAATATVRITDRLEPATLTIAPGTTVRFVNADDERHRMRSQSGPVEFDSGNLEPGESFSVRLSAAGTYTYLDERDDENTRYNGRIVVGSDGGGGSGGPGGSSGSAGSGSSPTSGSVSMAGRTFSPATVTIAAGGSVTFRNDDDRGHTVTANDDAFDSGTISEGGSWKRTFKAAGTFGYLCTLHPEMTGTVVVKGTTPASTPTPKPSPSPMPTPTPAAPEAEGIEAEAEARDFAFAPAELAVPAGATVTWRNAGAAPHTVTAEDASFDSDTIPAGGSWARTFETAGTFSYICALHPEMQGVVTVTDAVEAGLTAPPEPSPTPAAIAVAPPLAPAPSSPPVAEPGTAAVAARGGLPDGDLMARVAIVGLLMGGAILLFVRAVRGSVGRIDEQRAR